MQYKILNHDSLCHEIIIIIKKSSGRILIKDRNFCRKKYTHRYALSKCLNKQNKILLYGKKSSNMQTFNHKIYTASNFHNKILFLQTPRSANF